jgi:hypothetical protein
MVGRRPALTLVYFSPVPWDSYPQRPHYFVRHFLGTSGSTVLWIDPYPTRLPNWTDLARAGGPALRTPRPDGLHVLRLRGLPIEPLPGGRWVNRRLMQGALDASVRPWLRTGRVGIAVGRPSALALAALERLPRAWSVYDAMDDFPEFYRGLSRRSTHAVEQAIARRADVILTSSSPLWSKFESSGAARVMVRNAFEMASLPAAAEAAPGPTVFGYVGCVGEWFDWDAVIGLAHARPDASIEIVGPRVATPRGLPDNIVLRPACGHDDTIAHLARFSAGLIPFKRTRLTSAVDPIKYYAYRAMGLPVLSTRFGEMAARGAADRTFFMDDRGGPAASSAAALRERDDPATVRRFRADHDWSCRFQQAGLFGRVLPS